ncbi:D-tyrosyl-tRNA(Tyr) deacylase [Bacillus mesophilus]|uniref:D-aminoacyl-tRNA deacylase n=1 Tax=Bacillus mesophilus TaxID=1808955 RepID=A0A6M0Q635_9BACI|nr:D-aminoacyl-tRNA deacylase [Bacillus mesophilus]MBM7660700.1 D-tyrosyl-tRNA(Tyr) deacylase [Bacillus mesophilus]NEY71753.1 D-tyrosyl-tRNA(Tyr) deacylase [Bacillus mesophilus]
MRVIVQRARDASVIVKGGTVGNITNGFMLLVGVTHTDTAEDASYLANKIANLRVFEDESGKMNNSLLDVKGEILSVSQFTLYGDCRKGRRPNFMEAAKPEYANTIYEAFNENLRNMGIHVESGAFGEMMDVQFVNVGPVTLIVDSK